MPGGFPHLTVAFATLLLVALAAFTLGALLNSSSYTFVVLALATPVLIVMLTRSANRSRERLQPFK
jgi:hypothetical protein